MVTRRCCTATCSADRSSPPLSATDASDFSTAVSARSTTSFRFHCTASCSCACRSLRYWPVELGRRVGIGEAKRGDLLRHLVELGDSRQPWPLALEPFGVGLVDLASPVVGRRDFTRGNAARVANQHDGAIRFEGLQHREQRVGAALHDDQHSRHLLAPAVLALERETEGDLGTPVGRVGARVHQQEVRVVPLEVGAIARVLSSAKQLDLLVDLTATAERLLSVDTAPDGDADAVDTGVVLCQRAPDQLHHTRVGASREEPGRRRLSSFGESLPEGCVQHRRQVEILCSAGDGDDHRHRAHVPVGLHQVDDLVDIPVERLEHDRR
eukprot:7382752-Prymnesium_polylepis.4